jgi:hypothetical protein
MRISGRSREGLLQHKLIYRLWSGVYFFIKKSESGHGVKPHSKNTKLRDAD